MTEKARTVVVTGGSAGIGRAVAVALGKLKWRVALGARRPEPLQEAAAEVAAVGGSVFAHHLDVADAGSIEQFLGATEAALGPVDVLVSNAAASFPAALHERSAVSLEQEVRTNLLGPMWLCRGVVSSLVARGQPGDLVFVSSDASRYARPLQVCYCATKAGLEGMANALALELEGSGIRCIIVRPGPTMTTFHREWDFSGFDEVVERWQHFGLQRHFATLEPDDVAAAVVYALTAPPNVRIDTVEVQPLAPTTVPAVEPTEEQP